MTEIQYELEFFSPWHCGSGMTGGQDADYVPIVDKDGLPFVPGKTVKGLFREAAEVLFDGDFVTRVFGYNDPRDTKREFNGSAVWSNAALSREIAQQIVAKRQTDELKLNRYFIKIDERGQTVDKSLRRGEFIVPMTLRGTIEGMSDDDANKLAKCMGFIKRLGLQRSRGFGVCRFRMLKKVTVSSVANSLPSQREYYFRCRFLTQIVLNNTGATEGVMDTLEYIPGSNFMGIVAREYASFGEDAFLVFHSGKVRFGVAYPLDASGAATLPCPANWFIPKQKRLGEQIFSTPKEREDNQKELQPKQVRGGFFVPGSAPRLFGGLGKSYSLKSAYDSEKRRAEDGKLFGYTALPADSEWYFSLSADDDVPQETLRRVAAALLGRKQIGRSRNAQYGSVEISLLDKSPLPQLQTASSGTKLYCLYAASPLAFIDENGEPTLTPRMGDLGFPDDAKIDMLNTQILYHKYCPWNGARKSRDAERLVILPGSVIAVQSETPPDREKLAHGIGVFLSEGFGRVMCNPSFLHVAKLGPALKSASATASATVSPLLDYLDRRRLDFRILEAVYGEVEKFCGQWKAKRRITASQWGAVRAIAVASKTLPEMMDWLFKEEQPNAESPAENAYERVIKNGRDVHSHHPGFLRHGKMAKKWNNLADALKDFLTIKFRDNLMQTKELRNIDKDRLDSATMLFVELFASQMAKQARTKENGK